MAISVDRVYQKVLAFANKEQRGYITPQEFNLFADQAQMEIFEQYFYDINQWSRQHGNNTVHSDMLTNLEEKVSLFEYTAVGDNITVLNKWGDVNLDNDLPDLYRLMNVRVNYPTSSGYKEAELVNDRTEFHLLSSSKLTKSSVERPLYLRYYNKYDRMKIYPYPVDDDGSDFDLSTDEYTTTPVDVTGIIHPTSSYDNGRYFFFNLLAMQNLVGDFETGNTVTLDLYRNGSLEASDLNLVLWDNTSANSTLTGGHGRISDWAVGTNSDFQVGDQLDVTDRQIVGNKRNVRVDYIRKPLTPNWGYVVVNDKALYNSTSSTDFQLHLSEESELVYRILAFAGVAIEKPQLTQMAAGFEQAKVQQEKQ
tara:strand:+ start:24 stop:1121 length:1098 start_codon:yes stop_codon:yes gene_type:complete